MTDNIYIDKGDYIITTEGNAQDKVDVKINFKDNKDMTISVKNYSPESLARGVTNTSASLLGLLQNENDNDFINHYLNLSGIKEFRDDGNKENIVILIKKIVTAKLITGYNTTTGISGQKMNEANIFAVFNSRGFGKQGASIKLYSMADVLQGVFRNSRYQNIKVPTSLINANQWQPDVNTRLSNVLHQLNISVSYTLSQKDYEK